MVLASPFNAFTHPFTVLLALPFSASGVGLVTGVLEAVSRRPRAGSTG